VVFRERLSALLRPLKRQVLISRFAVYFGALEELIWHGQFAGLDFCQPVRIAGHSRQGLHDGSDPVPGAILAGTVRLGGECRNLCPGPLRQLVIGREALVAENLGIDLDGTMKRVVARLRLPGEEPSREGAGIWFGHTADRHALVDTDERGLVLEPYPASIQDRDGGRPMLRASRGSFPSIERVFTDSGYAGEKVATATVIAVEIVRKNPEQVGFAVQLRRWVVERFFA